MKRLILLAALALSSCGEPANRGADGYEFKQAEYFYSGIRVEIVEHPSATEFYRAAARAGARAEDGATLYAFAELYPPNRCRIHILDPRIDYRPEWLGHELAHCVYGRWHPARSGAMEDE